MFCFLVYNANLRQIGAGDTLPARYLPLIVWHNGTLDFDANARLVAHGHSMIQDWKRPADASGSVTYFEPWAYWLVRTRQNQLASLYPVVAPLLVTPLYFPAVIWLNKHGWEQPRVDRMAALMEKVSASLLASIASVLMFLVLRRDGIRWSLPLALAFAFGTNTWMISSQALWQHGSGELLIALALLLLKAGGRAPASPPRTAVVGAVCVFMAANRPPDALIAGAIVLFIVWSRRHSFWSRNQSPLWLLAGAAIPLAALLYYNLHFIGNLGGGYGTALQSKFVRLSLSGLAGLLVSPARGLLVFSPFLVFVPVGLIQRLRSPGSRSLAVALSLAATAQFIVYSQADWRAGVSWGPRWLTDLLPILVWMLAPVTLIPRPGLVTRGLLILGMTASIGVQTIGAFWYTGASDERIYAGDPQSMSGAWNPHNVPFIAELDHPRPPSDILCNTRGWIDRIGATELPGAGDVPVLENGAVIEGWAFACNSTPAQLLVLIDGLLIGSTQNFLPRPDVNQATHTLSPPGWRVSANTRGVSPGEHVLQIAVPIAAVGDIRIVREQRVFVTTPERLGTARSGTELDAMAEQADTLLRARQSRYGFWLTLYTNGLRYEAPRQEMNTYLTSMLVDLLSPIAHERGLDDVVERARRHLAAQIESNGLVRYHGLPDGPTIGTLGCVITPDADDTALVWRIAASGAGDPRQRLMLSELAQYRDARGLYRTWLAPRNQYQCLDPGSDPDPADIAINMHVYLMLRELDPPAARDLCNALQRSFGDDNIWVYYKKAPLVPYLRAAELRRLGCPLPLPTERLALPAAGQEIWTEAVRLLAETPLLESTPSPPGVTRSGTREGTPTAETQRTERLRGGSSEIQLRASPPDASARKAIVDLLVRIGSDDFAQLRRSPPLLYHNDLSATVPRFYWSEDFGYALWLRLYEAARVEPGELHPPSP